MKTRVLLADDHQMFRQGLRSMLEHAGDFEVVAEASNGREAVEQVESKEPDVVVMDIAMPGLNGVEAARQILSRHDRAEPRIIALSMHSDAQFVSSMLEAGASAYLLKDCALEELVTAIRSVLKGRVYLSPSITGPVVDDYVRRIADSREKAPAEALTAREREVLQLLAEGHTTKEIADQLYVSPKTVETHRHHIMDKVGIRTIAGLTKYAIRQGLTSEEP